jgi:DNA-binding CsgD family transcriptional regulator
VLVLSQYVEEAYALELLSESTERTGYLLKDRIADVGTLTDAVRRVANGGSALDPEVVGLLLGRRRREDPLAALTPREGEVLGLMAEGRSNSAMADALVISERAVEKHVTAIISKLNLPPAVEDHRRVLAVLAFLRSAYRPPGRTDRRERLGISAATVRQGSAAVAQVLALSAASEVQLPGVAGGGVEVDCWIVPAQVAAQLVDP